MNASIILDEHMYCSKQCNDNTVTPILVPVPWSSAASPSVQNPCPSTSAAASVVIKQPVPIALAESASAVKNPPRPSTSVAAGRKLAPTAVVASASVVPDPSHPSTSAAAGAVGRKFAPTAVVASASVVPDPSHPSTSAATGAVGRRNLTEMERKKAVARAFSPEQCIILEAMQREIDQLRKQDKINTKQIALQRTMLEMLGGARPATEQHPLKEFKQIETAQELAELNSRLGSDVDDRVAFENWLKMKIIGRDASNRLHEAIDLIFSRSFFAQCSWTGHGKTEKVSLQAYTHVFVE